MAKKPKILYCDDRATAIAYAMRQLEEAFPNHKVVLAGSSQDVSRRIRSIDSLAIAILDGDLGMYSLPGWEIAERLRNKGFEGPILYIGGTPVPKEYQGLFSAHCDEKTGSGLINAIRKHLPDES